MTEKKVTTPKESTKETIKRSRNSIRTSKKVKQGSSIGLKGLLIGIGVLFILIVGITFFFFFFLIKNPSVGKGLGLTISAIKNITSIFAALFFGFFFFLFLGLGISYLYKLATKSTNKIKNTILFSTVFILGIINIILGVIVFKNIYSIKDDTGPVTSEVLIANIIFSKDNQFKLVPMFLNNYPLIGPIGISFQLNTKIFNQVYLPQVIKQENSRNIKLIKFILNCGNGQTITYKDYKFSPYKYCLYLEKGSYTINLTFVYKNYKGQIKRFSLPEKNVQIASNIGFKTPIKLNDEKNEIIAGEVGDKITLDIKKVPLDLGLTENDILIDFLGNGSFQDYKGLASFTYDTDKLYHVKIKIPKGNYPIYTFPLRILPSTKPICNISYRKQAGNEFIFTTTATSSNGAISKISYTVINISMNSVIKRGNKRTFSVILHNGSDYEIKYKIKDIKGKIGECHKIIKLSNKVNYKYDIRIKTPYETIITGNENIKIDVKQLPSKFNIKIEKIFPKTYSEIGFDIDGDGQIDDKGKSLTIKISKKKNKKISTIVKDQYGNIKIKNILFKINLKHLIVILKSNRYKGSVPLKVKFDASNSHVTNSGDAIAFFHWDFGDGEKMENTRQGVVFHTYKKPGKYFAKVTIETDQGYKAQTTKKIIVFKPVNTSTIVFPDNLGGQAKIGEPLKIQVNTNGPIKNIEWDFGDGNTFPCEGRECTTITHIYNKKGLFTITAKIGYLDGSPSSRATAKINIIDSY